jgi:hypothetical protein
MGIARDRDVISGAVLAALGVFILSQALQWNLIGPDGPGPGFFPVGYGVLMTGLSLYLVVKSAVKPDPAARTAVDWSGTGRALGTWGLFAGSIALMDSGNSRGDNPERKGGHLRCARGKIPGGANRGNPEDQRD